MKYQKRPPRPRAIPLIKTSVNISPELYNKCKDNNIKFNEALRVGISMILAEKGLEQYDNQLNLTRRMNYFRMELEKSLEKLQELEDKKQKDEGIETFEKKEDGTTNKETTN